MRTRFHLIVAGCSLLLVGCGNTSQVLGLGRNVPDEFAVVDRAPLSLPPDYALRPPQPGAPRPQDVPMSQRASTILFGQHESGAQPAQGEQALLEAAGAEKVDPAIRSVIDREASQRVTGSRYLLEDLLGWKTSADRASTVDAAAESARIREAQEKDEPLTETPTPIIEKKRSGWLF